MIHMYRAGKFEGSEITDEEAVFLAGRLNRFQTGGISGHEDHGKEDVRDLDRLFSLSDKLDPRSPVKDVRYAIDEIRMFRNRWGNIVAERLPEAQQA